MICFKDKKLIIWGTGNHATECTEVVKKYKGNIVAYCDNNKLKWGKVFGDTVIISPYELLELCQKEVVTLIIASRYYEEIKEQVKEYSLENIIIFQDLYAEDAAHELEKTYSFSAETILELISKHKFTLDGVFDDYLFYTERLENELENILFELKYGLSVCAIIKNEGEYIVEWIEYHRMVGIEHFYIYDNESTDNLYELLKVYIEADIVTYIRWSGVGQQLLAYNDAIEKYQLESKYIAFIDADEFLVPVVGENVFEIVDEIFQAHVEAGGIGVNWRAYGTSFHKDKMSGLLFANYKYRVDDFHKVNAHIKTICNPRRTIAFLRNPHAAVYKRKCYCISEHGSYIPDAFFYDGMCKKLRLNHYLTKSESEFRIRCLKGKATSENIKYTEKMIEDRLEEMRCYNEIFDNSMDRFIPELEKRCISDSKKEFYKQKKGIFF